MICCTQVLLHLEVIRGLGAFPACMCQQRHDAWQVSTLQGVCVWLQFIWGMGAGSASLVRHVSGWTLASISGFTGAFSRVLIHAVVARGQERCDLQLAKQAHAIGSAEL